MKKKQISALERLNEAYQYSVPSSFSRGIRLELGEHFLFLISGTASVDARGRTAHIGDFDGQAWHTFNNIARLLNSADAAWKDVVKTTVFLKDMKYYERFNKIRTKFYNDQNISPYPASTCVQATLCRDELLIEIEALAIRRKRKISSRSKRSPIPPAKK